MIEYTYICKCNMLTQQRYVDIYASVNNNTTKIQVSFMWYMKKIIRLPYLHVKKKKIPKR